MSELKIGWATQEVIGINPMIYVIDAIRRNEETVNSSNIGELIKLCFSLAQNRKEYILDRIAIAFPHLEYKINKYRILV
jgi:hypothetical protein